MTHVRALEALESSGHKDPFNRLIAAQAAVENLSLVTADSAFREYFPGEGGVVRRSGSGARAQLAGWAWKDEKC